MFMIVNSTNDTILGFVAYKKDAIRIAKEMTEKTKETFIVFKSKKVF